MQTHVIFTNYDDPPPIDPLPALFGFCAFSLVAYVFPLSLNFREQKPIRYLLLVIGALLFTVLYTMGLSALEWSSNGADYSYWNGFWFTLTSSGLLYLGIYTAISLGLYLVVISKTPTTPAEYLQQLSYRKKNQLFFISVSDILYFEANDNYVSIYFGNNSRELVRSTLVELEKQLDPKKFLRIHRRHIINLDFINSTRMVNGDRLVRLQNGPELRIGRSHRSKFKLTIKQQ